MPSSDDDDWLERERRLEREEAAEELRYQRETQELDHADAIELVRSQGASRVAKLQTDEVGKYLDELVGVEPEPEMRQLPPVEWNSPTGSSFGSPSSAASGSPVSIPAPECAAPVVVGFEPQPGSIAALSAAEQAEEDEWMRGFGDHSDADEAEWEDAAWDEGEGEVTMRAGAGWDELDELEEEASGRSATASASAGGVEGNAEDSEDEQAPAAGSVDGGVRRYELRYTLVHPARRNVQLCVAGDVLCEAACCPTTPPPAHEGCGEGELPTVDSATAEPRVVVVGGLIHDRRRAGSSSSGDGGGGGGMAKQYTVEYLLRAFGVSAGEGVDDDALEAMVENLPLGILLLWLPPPTAEEAGDRQAAAIGGVQAAVLRLIGRDSGVTLPPPPSAPAEGTGGQRGASSAPPRGSP
eukprot:COSAG05_NODE_1263_length_5338_cov_44.046956_5_plen_411_part_00